MGKYSLDEERAELIRLVTSGEATVRQAAGRLEVAPSTGYRWMKTAGGVVRRRVRGGGVAEPMFAELVARSELAAELVVRVGAAAIPVRRGFDGDLLRAVVSALAGGAE